MERCMGLTVGLDKCEGRMLSAEVQWLSATVCGRFELAEGEAPGGSPAWAADGTLDQVVGARSETRNHSPEPASPKRILVQPSPLSRRALQPRRSAEGRRIFHSAHRFQSTHLGREQVTPPNRPKAQTTATRATFESFG